MKKKVMYITQSNGGVAIYLQMMLKYIDKSKYEQILVYPIEYMNEKEKFINLVDKIEFIHMKRNINFMNDFKSILSIHKLIKKYNPDLIYVHSSKAGALGRIADMFIKKPIIYNPHGWAFNMRVSNKKKNIYKIIERILSKMCDKVIAISNEEKESALENKICLDNKLQVITNGIDVEKFEHIKLNKIECRRKLNIPERAFVVGMVGRISKQKAPDTFIKVAARIKRDYSNSYFVIVGDGEDKTELIKSIEKYKLTQCVLITGWVDNPYEYIKTFDVAMLLSRWEGFGLAVTEYMISEVPVIATNVDGIPNIITNNKDGILVKVDDIDEIYTAVLKLKNDLKFSKILVDNAKVKVRDRFNVKRVVLEHEKLFDLILEEGKLI